MNPNRHIRLRWLSSDEATRGMEAIRLLWRSDHILARDEALFRWQYGQGHDSKHLGFLIAEDGDTIVACSGLMLLPWHRYGAPLRGGVGAITIVAPEYREQALGLQLIREADNGLQIIGSFGINKRIAMLFRLQGRHVLPAFPRRICHGDPQSLEIYAHMAGYEPEAVDQLRQSCGALLKKSPENSYRIEELSFDNLMEWDAAWQTLFEPKLIGVARHAAYMRWRYLEHPRFAYKGLLVRHSSGEICGMAVLREIPLPGEICAVRILDFLARDEYAGKALAAAISELIPANCAYVEHFSLGQQGIALEHIGLSTEGSQLFSVYTSPPDYRHCSILSALLVSNVDGYTARTFAESPDIYVTLADGDQDRPN